MLSRQMGEHFLYENISEQAYHKKLQEHVGGGRMPISYIGDTRGWIPWCGPDGEFLHKGDLPDELNNFLIEVVNH
jgi:hypothetical protein